MSMKYLVTCEDEDGMWFDEPLAARTKEDAIAFALTKWPTLHHSKALVLYRCDMVEEIETEQTT